MPAREDLAGRIAFIQEAERLKNVLRSAFTSTGRHESTAEHTWRLCLMAMTFADLLGPVDVARVLKLCIVHDLGEALNGDIPAQQQAQVPDKAARERRDLETLAGRLPAHVRSEILALWDEYDRAESREARVVKALDKLETIVQHNQGRNPADFDYAYNLEYGKGHTSAEPVFAAVRAMVDEETARHVRMRAAVIELRECGPADLEAVGAVINDAAEAYRRVIPADRWHEPYMPIEELRAEVAAGVAFWGAFQADSLLGVMGLQLVGDVALVRHAYTRTSQQGRGVGAALLAHLRASTDRPMLVGTWRAAVWAIGFYQRAGFRLVSDAEKDALLRRYWTVPARQIEESVVLADPRWPA